MAAIINITDTGDTTMALNSVPEVWLIHDWTAAYVPVFEA
jgi:hypothetical protein